MSFSSNKRRNARRKFLRSISNIDWNKNSLLLRNKLDGMAYRDPYGYLDVPKHLDFIEKITRLFPKIDQDNIYFALTGLTCFENHG